MTPDEMKAAASAMGRKGGTNSRKYMSKERATELAKRAVQAREDKRAILESQEIKQKLELEQEQDTPHAQNQDGGEKIT